jgi:hypothetical protein
MKVFLYDAPQVHHFSVDLNVLFVLQCVHFVLSVTNNVHTLL